MSVMIASVKTRRIEPAHNCNRSSTGCGDGAASRGGLSSLIRDYRRKLRRAHNADLEFYRDLPSLEDAVHHAAMAIRCDGKRQPHQRRLKWRTLKAVRDQLMSRREVVRAAHDFEQIFREVE